MTTITYEWERDDNTVTLEIGYDWSRLIPASMSGPAEGGVSLDYVTATAIKWFDEDCNELPRVATVDELSEAEQAFPSDKAWELACADYAERDDNAKESAVEARAERLAELREERGY